MLFSFFSSFSLSTDRHNLTSVEAHLDRTGLESIVFSDTSAVILSSCIHKKKVFVGPPIPLGASVEYLPITAKDKCKARQFGKKTLNGMFLGYVLRARGIWSGDSLPVDGTDLQALEAKRLIRTANYGEHVERGQFPSKKDSGKQCIGPRGRHQNSRGQHIISGRVRRSQGRKDQSRTRRIRLGETKCT